MEISQNTTGFSNTQTDKLLGSSEDASAGSLIGEGRIESVKDGVAMVRMAGNSVVKASVDPEGVGLGVGAKVLLFQASDGTVTAKTPSTLAADLQSQTFRILIEDLRTLMGTEVAGPLAKSLSKGDLETARKQIAEIWRELKSAPAEDVPAELQSWLDKKVPAMLSRPGEAPAIPGGAVALSLGAPTAREGEYHAQVAGQPAKLLGPIDLPSGPKGLWQSRQVPGGGAVWAPAPTLKAEVLARPLPERVPAGADGARELFEWAGVEPATADVDSLGRYLEAIAKEFATADGRAKADPEMPVVRQITTRPVALAESQAESLGVKDVPVAMASMPVPVPEKTMSPKPGMAADDFVGQAMSVKPTSPNLELPKAVAERALVAWALELPDDPVVHQAVLGQWPSVADSMSALAKLVAEQPGAHPVVERLLAELGTKDVVAPQGAKAHGRNQLLRENLAQAVFEALSRTDDSTEQSQVKKALQQAASALVQESLEPPRQGGHEYPPAVFQARNAEGKMEEGRIVVHDRRKKKSTDPNQSDHHTVEIEMRPAGLGPVKARLDLRGKVLTTRLEAREAETAALLESRADELRDAFKRIGLEPGRIDVDRPKSAARIDPRKRGSGISLDLRV